MVLASLVIFLVIQVPQLMYLRLQQAHQLMLLLHPLDYTLIETSDVTCNPIKTKKECQKAAQKLALSDITVENDGTDEDPPYCYIEGSYPGGTYELKFNKDGTNTGPCFNQDSSDPQFHDRCLCHLR